MVSLKAVKMNAGDLTTRDNSRLTSMEYATEYMLAVMTWLVHGRYASICLFIHLNRRVLVINS